MPFRDPSVTLFLCGDVMTGRGVDQILEHSVNPQLHEPWVKDARDYVKLAERRNGPIDQPVSDEYIWGDALAELEQRQPALRFINLETSITTSSTPWPGKGIHYRMHPGNVSCLKAAGVDGCSVANNHVLDWDQDGLSETLEVLEAAGIAAVGAGRNADQASQPAIFDIGEGRRAVVCACGLGSSGVSESWAAGPDQAGVFRLPDLSRDSVRRISEIVSAVRKEDDIAILSIHWGSNWGYDVEDEQKRFAHDVIDSAGIDLVHGHSSHHPRGMEVYRNRLILYGCGDFINDYEGISGNEEYRGDLTLMYFPSFSVETGELLSLHMVPLKMEQMRLRYPSQKDREWLAGTIARINRPLGTACDLTPEGELVLGW
ncbi:CapA family protein [Marinobacter sp.]|uniref:CapA family protein n=1 Tax=Marinobacter sp. TaxID=50741 RepID=UPI00384A4CB5